MSPLRLSARRDRMLDRRHRIEGMRAEDRANVSGIQSGWIDNAPTVSSSSRSWRIAALARLMAP
jgi:hypothetical protein